MKYEADGTKSPALMLLYCKYMRKNIQWKDLKTTSQWLFTMVKKRLSPTDVYDIKMAIGCADHVMWMCCGKKINRITDFV